MVYLHQEHGQHVEAISLQLHQALVDCELFKPETIKVRVLAMQAMVVAGKGKPYIHVELKLLSGRTEQQKKHIAMLIKSALRKYQQPLSVEVVDLSESYFSTL